MAENPGTIREEDSTVEVLYKMNEHFNHILSPISELVTHEEWLRKFIKNNNGVLDKVKVFEALPQAIEDES